MFGGVAFELLGDFASHAAVLPAECARHSKPGLDPRARAAVVCAVHCDSALLDEPAIGPGSFGNSVRFDRNERGAGSLGLRATGLRGELEPISAGHYAVTARVAPGADGMLALLRAVSAAIVQREGGLVLHAAGAEIDGRALLFVGPSGAGKSTALRQTERARCFAYDHVAVLPGSDGWLAWGLPGGTTARAPESSEIAFPLAAVARVRRAETTEPQLALLSGAEALFALRESVECADDSPGSEEVYLRAVTELCSEVAVFSIATVLGRSNDRVIDAALSTRSTMASRGRRS
ncbi:MAG: hypothetical protein ACHQ53_16765 [Polyangiales bacterium]